VEEEDYETKIYQEPLFGPGESAERGKDQGGNRTKETTKIDQPRSIRTHRLLQTSPGTAKALYYLKKQSDDKWERSLGGLTPRAPQLC